jgi:hypothetical protein
MALTAVREIRNYCAHSKVAVSFDDVQIEHWVRKVFEFVKTARNIIPSNSHRAIVSACALLGIHINYQMIRIVGVKNGITQAKDEAHPSDKPQA